MIAYNVTDRKRFKAVKMWMQEIYKYAYENVIKVLLKLYF